jgi:hypothetical protein
MMTIDTALRSTIQANAIASAHSALAGIEEGEMRIALPAIFGGIQAQARVVAEALAARGIRPVLVIRGHGCNAGSHARDIVEINSAALATSLGARTAAANGAVVVSGLAEDHVARVRRFIAGYDGIVVEISALPPTGYGSVLADLRFPLPSADA